MAFEDGQIDQAGLVEDAWHTEATQLFRTLWSPFNPILLTALRVYAYNANAVGGAEFFDAQDGVSGFAIKLGTGRLTEHWLRATGAHLFRNGFEQGETGS